MNRCEPDREDMSALEVLERYIEMSTSIDDVSQREILLSLTSGALRAALEGATDEAIKEAYIDRKIELDNYSVISERKRTPREVEITFQISYFDRSNMEEGDPPLVSAKNTVKIFKENEIWSVVDVIGSGDTEVTFGVTPDSIIKATP